MQYHSVNTMAMKLNPFSNPQLDDLPDTVSRKEVVRSSNKGMWWRILRDWWWMVSSLLTIIVLTIYGDLPVLSWLLIAMVVIFPPIMILCDRDERRRRIREILRTEHQVPICLCCGYLGASMDTQICSECGKPVEGRAKWPPQ